MPVELVFIHGWGYDARLWDAVSAALPQFTQTHIELGFFETGSSGLAGGLRNMLTPERNYVLVGHSLGFMYGITEWDDWRGWVAINSFPRFVKNATQPGCVEATALREMRMRLQNDPVKCLGEFYRSIGGAARDGTPNGERLREGLDQLKVGNIDEKLEKHAMPGLALAGGDDPLVPVEVSAALGGLAKRGGLQIHESGGHLLPVHKPIWCARHIADFVTGQFNS